MPADLTARALRDRALPLAEALDPQRMREPLARAAGLPAAGPDMRGEVINHKPGVRCTIAYAVGPARLVGKLYARPVLAQRAHTWTVAVRAATARPDEPSAVPEPRALMPELGLGLYSHAPGADLGHALCAQAVVLAGRWLARLHATAPPAGVRAEPLAHELARLDAWCADVRPSMPPPAATELERAHERLHVLAAELPDHPPVLVHRDFYHENLLWDGARLWALDFDQLAVGDPALDVGHFQAHLEMLAYRRIRRPQAHAAVTARFARAAPPVGERALRLYRAQTFLKLAATEVQRRRQEWQLHARAFAGLACEEAARARPLARSI